MYEQSLLTKCVQAALDEVPPRERVLTQQYLGLDVHTVTIDNPRVDGAAEL